MAGGVVKRFEGTEAAQNIELKHLRVFLAVAESGSLGEAAKRLKISQPNLTHVIQSLERSVGGLIFVRSSRGMTPSALGRALEARARVITGEVGRMWREVGELLDIERGSVVVGGGSAFAHPAIKRALKQFCRTYPKVEIEIRDMIVRQVIPAVKAGEVDYAIATVHKLGDDEVTQEVLLPDQRVSIFAGANDPIARKRRVSLQEIWPGPWLLPAKGTVFRSRFEEFFRAAGLPPPQATIACSSLFLLKSYLLQGNIFTPLVGYQVGNEIERNLVRPVRIPELDWKFDIGVIYRTGVPLPPAAAKLLEGIREACAIAKDSQRP